MLKNYSKIQVDEYGNKQYLNDEGKHHRLDEPAVEFKDGTKYWFINGNRHRNIDPSYEWSDGGKRWCFKGKAHRVGGSCSSFGEVWLLYGKEYLKQEYYNKVWNI